MLIKPICQKKPILDVFYWLFSRLKMSKFVVVHYVYGCDEDVVDDDDGVDDDVGGEMTRMLVGMMVMVVLVEVVVVMLRMLMMVILRMAR